MSMRESLRNIPGVDRILVDPEIRRLKQEYGVSLVTRMIRMEVDAVRNRILHGGQPEPYEKLIARIRNTIRRVTEGSLTPVVNATGTILHTNLGRAPLGRHVLDALAPFVLRYSNLEFDLELGKRGQRNHHVRDMLRAVTGADDAVVVNNNAAGVFLTLSALASGREVIVSRGELIEIGGSFRIPDIMRQSGAILVETGTTNRTRPEDYEDAITENTAMILKVHPSNYYIGGFSREVSIERLSRIAREHDLPLVYDIGSGLLRRPEGVNLHGEPDIHSSLEAGADLVTFSCDKLLGGPQGGVVCGNEMLIAKLASHPLMRVVRVGKLTLAALCAAITSYFREDRLVRLNPAFRMMNQKPGELYIRAERLRKALQEAGWDAEVLKSHAHPGGGSLPRTELESYAVSPVFPPDATLDAEDVFDLLLQNDEPILAILREGRLLFDVMTLLEDDGDRIVRAMKKISPNGS